ncbi:glutamate receptor ionotropic, delta-1 [Anastrepha obliqua]|uniref:glutamate receptor ionotropic, delta-1 n=1 Tax=Anastrepha obliqua TaxID=95512 RepID=UPI0024097132|nr:glutamate receptor ionotropic, delta-1 [Anastrepha obliqua]XP_054732871.1 glutamate receptor ionotropic, delta-1 [Anastrepha obliqua]
MTGFELILSAALCLSCTNLNDTRLPANLIQLDENGKVITKLPELAADDSTVEEGLVETVNSIIQKEQKINGLKEWIKGRKLVIATLEDYPLSYTVIENDTRVGKGVAFELIDFLQEQLEFTYEVVVPEENIIGSREDYEKSLIKMLNNSEADVAAAFIPTLSEQHSFVFYSSTTLDEGEWIMVMQRPRESATGSGLMAPFDFWVWILIFISLLAVGPVIYMLIILRNRLTGDTEQKPYSLGHCAWFVYGALMKQGSTLSPIADSTRLLFATWWIFITILTSFYTANLTAFLTLSQFTLPYNTVSDILYKNKHFVSARGGGIEYAIRNTNESLYMLSNMIRNNHAIFSKSSNDTFNLQNFVEKDGYVFIRDRPAIHHLLYADYRYRKTISMTDEKLHCPFAMAKEPFLKKNRSFAYPIGSNLSELFDPKLLNLVESGIIKYLSSKDLPNAEICPQNLAGTERQLRNTDLMMTYYIMFAGFVTAVVVFFTEILFRYLNSRRETSKWARHGIGRTTNGLAVHMPRWLRQLEIDTDKKRLTASSSESTITPPPPYQSIFSNNHRHKHHPDASHLGKDGVLNPWRHHEHFGGGGFLGNYQMPGGGNAGGVRRLINGRDYMVFRNPNGQSQLVPVRAPSAALFQYTYTE